jgi:hypothetical protein
MRFNLVASMLAILGSAVAASATDIFNDFGPGNTYNIGASYTISTAASEAGVTYATAADFTPSGNYALSSLVLAIANISGADSLDISINSDAAGHPGAVLESWTSASDGTFGSQNAPIVLNSILNPVLFSGTQYWIVVFPGGADTWAGWNENNIYVSDPLVSQSEDGGSSWPPSLANAPAPAYEVTGSASSVPSPAPLTGGAVLLLALAASKRARCLIA